MSSVKATNLIEQLETTQDRGLLAQVDSLSTRDRTSVVNYLEEFAANHIKGLSIEELRFSKDGLETLGKLGRLGRALASAAVREDLLSESLFVSDAIAKVLEFKGDKADGVLKVFAEEARKVSDTEFQTRLGQLKIAIAVCTRLEQKPAQAAATPKGNPFRK